MTKKISTLADMAKLAGVSESTVSRALSGSKLVSERTRERIQALAHDVDFSVNSSARNLRLQKSNTIAVVLLISSENDQSATDPFILGLLGVIADELTKKGYDMLLASHKTQDKLWLARYFDSKRADGVIVFGQGDDPSAFDKLVNDEMPLVVWGAKEPNDRYITVGTDNFQGGKLATEHLIAQGCKRIAFAGHLSFETTLRHQGYQAAIKNAKQDEEPHLDVHFTYQDGYSVANNLLQSKAFPWDGIVAASDTIALGMIKAIRDYREQGNELQEVAIVGYDDIPVAGFTHPSLTTIKQDTHQGGKLLVENLFKQINKQDVESSVMETILVERESSQI